MSDDMDTMDHIETAKKAAEEAIEQFNGYDEFADAIDALASEQIKGSDEVHNRATAKRRGLADDPHEYEKAVLEADVRQEIGQTLFGLLEEYDFQSRQSYGADANAREK
ncbi:hypothetical protein [Halocatena halophila]|uniref:hypothetical protein n=1 Tax=Halocatena halophila TaxID=2814576 RepID=UPI002ED228C1